MQDDRLIPACTDRLRFRAWSADDLPLAGRLWGNVQVTARIGGPFSEARIATMLEVALESQRAHGFQYWPIFLLKGEHFVGCCGLRPHADPRRPELGFHLLPSWWGRGLAREAALGVIDHAFATRDIDGLFAGHHPDNAASARLLQSLGFERTGEELYPPTGLMHPVYRLDGRGS